MCEDDNKITRFKLSTDVLLRVDYSEKIENQYKSNRIYFGCPANWVDYAKKHQDGVADKFEAVFGHVKKGDPRLSMICDDGIPLNMFRSLWEDDGSNDTVYVRYIWNCLTPTACFFSVAAYRALKAGKKQIKIDLREYYKSLGLKQEECSLLIVKRPDDLYKELKQQIPNSVTKHTNIRIEDGFDNKNCLLASLVTYDLNIDEEFFDIDNVKRFKDIFRKRPKFSPQREARFIIPNIYFTADPVYREDAYKVNRLEINLPNLKQYTMIGDAKDADYIIFDNYSEDNDTIRISFAKENK